MFKLSTAPLGPPFARLRAHVRVPLYRNAYNLMLSTGASSALGLIYWMVAARYYPAQVVGVNAAALSMMAFLSGVAQLNLMSAMIRFIPQAGAATRRLVGVSYGLSAGLAVLMGTLFILGIQFWAPRLAFLAASPGLALWFILGIVAWSVFALQDAVLTGLRQTHWVPIENITYALAKIGLLVLFAAAWSQYGILASWTFPLVATLLPINALIFRRLIPQHGRATAAQAQPLDAHGIRHYVAGNYLGSLFTWASKGLLPLLVLQAAGGNATAYFYLPFNIAIGIKLMMFNMAMSLTVEGALDAERMRENSRRFFRHMARLIIPVVLVVEVAAPWILRASGRAYAAEGTTLLRLLALVALPNLINTLYVSTARVQRQVVGIVAAQGALCVLGLGLSALLLPRFGITGVGLALLGSESIVAGVVLLTALRPLLRSATLNQP